MMTVPSSFFTGTTSTKHGKELPVGREGVSDVRGWALPGPKYPGTPCPFPCWAPLPGEHPLCPPWLQNHPS